MCISLVSFNSSKHNVCFWTLVTMEKVLVNNGDVTQSAWLSNPEDRSLKHVRKFKHKFAIQGFLHPTEVSQKHKGLLQKCVVHKCVFCRSLQRSAKRLTLRQRFCELQCRTSRKCRWMFMMLSCKELRLLWCIAVSVVVFRTGHVVSDTRSVSFLKWKIICLYFKWHAMYMCGQGYLSRYNDSLRFGRYGDWILVGAKYSTHVRTRPGVHPALYNMGTVSFPELKQTELCVNHPPQSNAEVKGKIELYLYSFVSLCHVIVWNLPLPLPGTYLRMANQKCELQVNSEQFYRDYFTLSFTELCLWQDGLFLAGRNQNFKHSKAFLR